MASQDDYYSQSVTVTGTLSDEDGELIELECLEDTVGIVASKLMVEMPKEVYPDEDGTDSETDDDESQQCVSEAHLVPPPSSPVDDTETCPTQVLEASQVEDAPPKWKRPYRTESVFLPPLKKSKLTVEREVCTENE